MFGGKPISFWGQKPQDVSQIKKTLIYGYFLF
jgi:hypothetical protein